jgi:hypothetical protein
MPIWAVVDKLHVLRAVDRPDRRQRRASLSQPRFEHPDERARLAAARRRKVAAAVASGPELVHGDPGDRGLDISSAAGGDASAGCRTACEAARELAG